MDGAPERWAVLLLSRHPPVATGEGRLGTGQSGLLRRTLLCAEPRDAALTAHEGGSTLRLGFSRAANLIERAVG